MNSAYKISTNHPYYKDQISCISMLGSSIARLAISHGSKLCLLPIQAQ